MSYLTGHFSSAWPWSQSDYRVSSQRAWDEGLTWYLEQRVAPDQEPVELDFVRDEHLRSPNGDVEDKYIGRLIKTARRAAEHYTRRAIPVQTWAMVLDGAPSGLVVIPRPPLIGVTSIAYIDGDGVEQVYGGSPVSYQVSAPKGPTARRGRVAPAPDASWPAIGSGYLDPFTIEFECGYDEANGGVPDDIIHGMLLLIGEMYKLRSESVQSVHNNPAVVRARERWGPYKVF